MPWGHYFCQLFACQVLHGLHIAVNFLYLFFQNFEKAFFSTAVCGIGVFTKCWGLVVGWHLADIGSHYFWQAWWWSILVWATPSTSSSLAGANMCPSLCFYPFLVKCKSYVCYAFSCTLSTSMSSMFAGFALWNSLFWCHLAEESKSNHVIEKLYCIVVSLLSACSGISHGWFHKATSSSLLISLLCPLIQSQGDLGGRKQVMLGGRAAEEVMYGRDTSTFSLLHLPDASWLARKLVSVWGFFFFQLM